MYGCGTSAVIIHLEKFVEDKTDINLMYNVPNCIVSQINVEYPADVMPTCIVTAHTYPENVENVVLWCEKHDVRANYHINNYNPDYLAYQKSQKELGMGELEQLYQSGRLSNETYLNKKGLDYPSEVEQMKELMAEYEDKIPEDTGRGFDMESGI